MRCTFNGIFTKKVGRLNWFIKCNNKNLLELSLKKKLTENCSTIIVLLHNTISVERDTPSFSCRCKFVAVFSIVGPVKQLTESRTILGMELHAPKNCKVYFLREIWVLRCCALSHIFNFVNFQVTPRLTPFVEDCHKSSCSITNEQPPNAQTSDFGEKSFDLDLQI